MMPKYRSSHSRLQSVDLVRVERGLKFSENLSLRIYEKEDFPGGPVVKTLCSKCRGLGFNPWSGT